VAAPPSPRSRSRLGLGRPPSRGRGRGGGARRESFEQQPLLIDLAPTILAALGAPASIDHTGRVLHEVVGADAQVGKHADEPAVAKPAFQIPGMPSGSVDSNVSDTETDEMEEHLRGLAYLE
jgi:arylsulfatase A-like enzyme